MLVAMSLVIGRWATDFRCRVWFGLDGLARMSYALLFGRLEAKDSVEMNLCFSFLLLVFAFLLSCKNTPYFVFESFFFVVAAVASERVL